MAVAAAGSMVMVNTVALALAAFGAGSMAAALFLPRLLERLSDKPVMIAGATALVAGTAAGMVIGSFGTLLALWLVLGFGCSVAQTPAGRLLRRSAYPRDRPAVFAAQFALSHACWLICYPVAGYLGAQAGLVAAFAAMAIIGLTGLALAWRLWPADDPTEILHEHQGLPKDHSHHHAHGGVGKHHHALVIDDLHTRWIDGLKSPR